MTEKGWIKLHRQLIDWEWYSDINVKVLFLHCLLSANHEDKRWHGIEIKKGQFITSLEHLAIEVGLTVSQIRTAINKLKLTNEIAYETTSKYSIITIKKWDEYQTNDMQNDKPITNESQTDDKQIATNKNEKNEKNEKNILEEVVVSENENFYGEYYNVFLTDKHYKDLEVLIMSKNKLNEIINDLSVNIETGKENKYSSDLPNAHYERIKAYFNYRKKNPKNFVTEPDKKSTEEILKEMGLKFKTI